MLKNGGRGWGDIKQGIKSEMVGGNETEETTRKEREDTFFLFLVALLKTSRTCLEYEMAFCSKLCTVFHILCLYSTRPGWYVVCGREYSKDDMSQKERGSVSRHREEE